MFPVPRNQNVLQPLMNQAPQRCLESDFKVDITKAPLHSISTVVINSHEL